MSEDLTMRECLLRDINDLKRERDELRADQINHENLSMRYMDERDEARAWSARWKNAARDWRRFAQDFWRRKRVLAQERNHWKSESLEQAKLLAMSADREEKLRDALKYVAGLDTSQDASPQQCSAVLVAMEALQ
jgi:hypothetical protein